MNDQSFHSTVYQAQIIRVFIVSPWIEVKISAHWIIIIQGIWLKKNTLDLWVRYLHVRAIWMHIYICLRINAYWCDCGACHTYNEQNKNSWKAQLARIGTPTTRLTYRPLTPRPYVCYTRGYTHTHTQTTKIWSVRNTWNVLGYYVYSNRTYITCTLLSFTERKTNQSCASFFAYTDVQ